MRLYLLIPLVLTEVAACARQPQLPANPRPGDDAGVYAYAGLVAGLRNETRRLVYDGEALTLTYIDSVAHARGKDTWRVGVPEPYRLALARMERAAQVPHAMPVSLHSGWHETRAHADPIVTESQTHASCGAYSERMPGATGYFRFSPIGWGADSLRALVFVEKRCWWGPGLGGELLLLSRDGQGSLQWDTTLVLWHDTPGGV